MKLLLRREVGGEDDENEGDDLIPGRLFLKNEEGEDAEGQKGQHFLDDLQLGKGHHFVSRPIRGHLEAVLEERYAQEARMAIQSGVLFDLR